MALLRKLFYKKPPDGLLEISERLYVFDCCFTTDAWEQEDYKGYVANTIGQLKDYFPDSSILIFNFREGESSQIASALSEYDMTIMDYPRQYEGCPLLPMELMHHFLRSSESWLSLGQQNILLMHCERGGWPVLAFMLAALLLYRKQYSGEYKTLDMVYKQAPRELLHIFSPLNPLPSQLRYLQYVSRRNVATEWPPLDRALTLDCVIIRFIPAFDGEGCCPIFRIYGQDPFFPGDRTAKLLFSTPKKSKAVRHYKQVESELVKIDINCHVQGDVVLECISLQDDLSREKMMYRAVFNTSFIRSNILMLNRDEIDTLWDAKDLFPQDFRAELLFSDMDTASSTVPVDLSCFEEEGLPIEAFAKVQEMFSSVDWLVPKSDAALSVLHQIAASDIAQEKLETGSQKSPDAYQDKKSTASLENKSKREKPSSPDAGGHKVDGQTFGPRSDVETQKTSAMHQKSSSPPPMRSDEKSTSSPPPSVSSPPSTNKERSPASRSHLPSSQPSQEVADNKVKPAQPPPSPPPSIGDLDQPPSLPSMRPPSPSIKDTKVEHSQLLPSTPTGPETPPLREKRGTVLEPARSPPSDHQIGSPFPPSILRSSSLKTDKTETERKIERSQSLTSPPTVPGTPPLKDKRGTETSQTTPHPEPSAPTSSFVYDKGARPPPALPLPPTSFKEDQATQSVKDESVTKAGPSPPPPPPSPPLPARENRDERVASPVPPPPPPPPAPKLSSPHKISSGPPPPPPPMFSANGNAAGVAPPPPPPRAGNSSGAPTPPPPLAKGPGLPRIGNSRNQQSKKLKPLHWLKLTRAVQGSLWAETQKSSEAAKAPEIDISELESLFSAANPKSDEAISKSKAAVANKPEKVQLIEHRRAYNCEIMLSKVKIPLNELMDYVLALEESALDADQVENLLKFCPTKEEMELLKGYKGEKDKLGKCEQFFLELMKVPRTESKLRVFSFKLQFHGQVSDLRKSLNIVNSAVEQTRGSHKLKRVMQTILQLGNALNQGTARGSAIGFRLDSLLKLTETRARNNKMTLMHYLCKVLADKLPEVLDFSKDLESLEPAAKIQLKFLAEEMQAISKGLEKVVQELSMSENDGPVSANFRKALRDFLISAEGEARSLASLYSAVGKSVDSLILYFGEDPARCPYEQVVSTLLKFVRMFNQANEENTKNLEAEKKKAEKEALEKKKADKEASNKEASNEKLESKKVNLGSEQIPPSPVKTGE